MPTQAGWTSGWAASGGDAAWRAQAAQLEKGGADRLRARCAELEERWAGALGRADAAAEETREIGERLRETEMALQVWAGGGTCRQVW